MISRAYLIFSFNPKSKPAQRMCVPCNGWCISGVLYLKDHFAETISLRSDGRHHIVIFIPKFQINWLGVVLPPLPMMMQLKGLNDPEDDSS